MTPSLLLVPSARKSGKLYSVLPIDGSGDLTFTRASTAIETNGSDLLSSVATGVPRLDYADSTCPKLLLEPARTNLLRYSEDFDNAIWLKIAIDTGVAPIVTANAGIAPDGTMSADRVQFSAPALNDRSILRQTILPLSTIAQHSYWVKSYSGATQYISGHAGSTTSGIEVTNEWQRITFNGTGAGVTYSGLMVRNGVTGSDSADILVWGAQCEDVSTYPTSYIPTTSATVTRVAESVSKTGIANLIGQSEGTIFFEGSVPTTNTGYFLSIAGANANDRFIIGYNSSGVVQLDVRVNAAQVALITGGTYLANQNVKIAATYKLNEFKLYVNGVKIGEDLSGSVSWSTPLQRFLFESGGGTPFYGECKQLAVYTTALNDTELLNLTK